MHLREATSNLDLRVNPPVVWGSQLAIWMYGEPLLSPKTDSESRIGGRPFLQASVLAGPAIQEHAIHSPLG